MKATRVRVTLIANWAVTETRVIIAMSCKHHVPFYQLEKHSKPRGIAVSVTHKEASVAKPNSPILRAHSVSAITWLENTLSLIERQLCWYDTRVEINERGRLALDQRSELDFHAVYSVWLWYRGHRTRKSDRKSKQLTTDNANFELRRKLSVHKNLNLSRCNNKKQNNQPKSGGFLCVWFFFFQ